MLDRGEVGEYCSLAGVGRLLREVLGDAAGDNGALGPYVNSGTGIGIGMVVESENNGCRVSCL